MSIWLEDGRLLSDGRLLCHFPCPLTVELPSDCFLTADTSLISIYDDHGVQIKSAAEMQITVNATLGVGIVELVHVMAADGTPCEDASQEPDVRDGELVFSRRTYPLASIRVKKA